jgi:hypothetical protein
MRSKNDHSLQNAISLTLTDTEARARFAFVLMSRLYRQMYVNTGIATDSAWVAKSARRARHCA